MLAIYLLVALGLALFYIEPQYPQDINLRDIVIGISVGLTWPILLFVFVISTTFIAVAIWARGL
jgi:hypothetical protein